ncbi:N-acetylmuramoyl-L-alanine amidase [Lysobacter pythonis]|uniref:N-acetylmuramoyl-L-alanine amidase n=1 Tax=Solilutibacter pythonis TaxID=2483112 RepID=A0A3M2HRD8_9GAMM|nr:N-acetylmuramoyl-L-alanine amidase [Lysobacter pythonis]RMH88344.1 N-acetylmuramoyl-L-alanine amidase [Lysobacter pythonis]
MREPAIDILDRPLPYAGHLGARALHDIDLVVIHCTELPDLATAREYGERVLYPHSRSGNSGHYYIDRDGRIERWVAETRIAHHVRGMNAHSLGIELVNRGRWPDWLDSRNQAMDEPYAEAQIAALIALLRALHARLPALARIAGHDELDTETVEASDDPSRRVCRKRDPGPRFPWARVLAGSPLVRIGQAALPPDER